MAAAYFRVSAKRNTNKSTLVARMSVLALAGAMLFSFFLFGTTREHRAAASRQQVPERNLASNSTPPVAARTTEQARAAYGQMPLSFEANLGQAGEPVDFVARGAGYTLALSPTKAAFRLRKDKQQTAISKQKSAVLTMKLAGANAAATVAGIDELEGKVNYFIGNDPAKWRTAVPTFERVRYTEVYPGIDVIYYGNQKRLEYDFVVAPGRDARAITLEFAGAQKVELDAATGDLLVRVGEETIRQLAPLTYQETAGGGRREVESRYSIKDGSRVGFEVGEYDGNSPLVIDPVLQYSTFLGGINDDGASGIAVDSAGNAYVTGSTNSANFPTANAIQGTITPSNGDVAGDYDVFVTKINAAGTALVYSTYLGGNTGDGGLDIALDSAGNAYVTGQTRSANFPTANAIDSTYNSANDVFVTKINPAGSALVYSSYLGGTSDDFGHAITLDSANNVYLTGETSGGAFPTVNAFDSTFNGSSDAFVTKINAAGTALIYSTYLGGSIGDGSAAADHGNDIAVDAAGNAYITGETDSTNFPTFNAIQSTKSGTFEDAFVTKLNAAGSALVYSTYLGGTSDDHGSGITLDSANNAYITGETRSSNFPTANGFDSTHNLSSDAFVTKINAAGTTLVFSSFLGGSGVDIAQAIVLDPAGNIYVTGYTSSTNFPTVSPSQAFNGGSFDVFVTKINPAGSGLIYSTYIGGGGFDLSNGIALDPAGNAYVTGETPSGCLPFPTTTGAFDTTYNGGGDAFISKISETAPPSTLTGITSAVQFTQASYPIDEDVNFVSVTVMRTGDTATVVTVDFATSNGTASERSDYTTALGTLRFAAGETSKTVDLLVNEDSFVEGTDTFTVALSNASAGTCIGTPSTATVFITDDASEPLTNVIDDAQTFVGHHYHDFLNRQHDLPGLNFWTSDITVCGSNAACIDNKRTNVSQAFFLSIEFQQTGYLVFRFYKETFTDSVARPRGMPRYQEFLRDTREMGRGVVVGQGSWEQQLETNKQDFALRWVQKAEFIAEFPLTLIAAQFVDKLFLNAETTPTNAERNAAIAAFGSGDIAGRAAALRSVADSGSVYNRQFNAAFVLMQYIGYLRRNPNDAPEPGLNYGGFDFWLAKMNQFSIAGEDVRSEPVARARAQRAEMVRAFILSAEYRGRFGT
jgi:hypothetical protein